MASFLSAGRKSAIGALAKTPFKIQARGMASEQQLKQRIGSVETCKKITSAMKMVAAAKLRGAQDRLDIARVFGKDVPAMIPEPTVSATDKGTLLIPITGDKGLCGGVNSQLIRFARDGITSGKFGEKGSVVVSPCGEKMKKGLERMFGEQITTAISENGRLKPATFRQISLIADTITAQEHTNAVYVYQYFRSMAAYDATEKYSVSAAAMTSEHRSHFYGYKIAGTPDTLFNLNEFSVACNLTLFFAESETATLSSRMTAMDNSSNNAGDMLNALQLLLNRNRQSRITTELTEIISGASAVEEE